MSVGLVYIGMIIKLEPIENADFIVSATVVCGKGGKWRGIVRKAQFNLTDLCIVYLPDAQIPERDDMKFMQATHWRVKMRRFKAAPSEVVIMPLQIDLPMGYKIGTDLTEWCGVTKYEKPIPANLAGKAKGLFPGFIPKTDEPNYQSNPDLVESLIGKPYYISLKCDGSSSTAFKYKGEFGVCSRNLEMIENENNGYWQIANRYDLKNKLPEGIALQWETCGPKIQSNPLHLKQIDGFAFSAYDIEKHCYLEMADLINLCRNIGFPMVTILTMDQEFHSFGIEHIGEGKYSSGNQREGVVVRSQHNIDHGPISFKVINLNYEK